MEPARVQLILVALINPRWRGGSSAAFRVFTVARGGGAAAVNDPRWWGANPNSGSATVYERAA